MEPEEFAEAHLLYSFLPRRCRHTMSVDVSNLCSLFFHGHVTKWWENVHRSWHVYRDDQFSSIHRFSHAFHLADDYDDDFQIHQNRETYIGNESMYNSASEIIHYDSNIQCTFGVVCKLPFLPSSRDPEQFDKHHYLFSGTYSFY